MAAAYASTDHTGSPTKAWGEAQTRPGVRRERTSWGETCCRIALPETRLGSQRTGHRVASA
eukprot:3250551-Rhodomonas_salina.3